MQAFPQFFPSFLSMYPWFFIHCVTYFSNFYPLCKNFQYFIIIQIFLRYANLWKQVPNFSFIVQPTNEWFMKHLTQNNPKCFTQINCYEDLKIVKIKSSCSEGEHVHTWANNASYMLRWYPIFAGKRSSPCFKNNITPPPIPRSQLRQHNNEQLNVHLESTNCVPQGREMRAWF